MNRKLSLMLLVFVLALGSMTAVSSAADSAAAWEASAAYLSTLPEGFNGISGEALKAKLDPGETIFLLDVRQPNEFATGRIEGAVNIPVRDVPKNLAKLPQDKNAPIVVVCAGAVRSGYVAMALSFQGYTNVKHLGRGYVVAWQNAGYAIQK